MRHLAVIGALWFLAAISANAQIQIDAQTARSNFLLYERVDLIITLTNNTGNDPHPRQQRRPSLAQLRRLPAHP